MILNKVTFNEDVTVWRDLGEILERLYSRHIYKTLMVLFPTLEGLKRYIFKK